MTNGFVKTLLNGVQAFVRSEVARIKTLIVQPDWNQNDETAPDYVQNRTHYAYTDTLYEATIETPNDWGYFGSENAEYTGELPTIGAEYTVTFDGVDYTCIAENPEWSNADYSTFFGADWDSNAGAYDWSEYPFELQIWQPTGEQNVLCFLACQTAGTHTIKIVGENVQMLDMKYIPNADWDENDHLGSGYVKNRTHWAVQNRRNFVAEQTVTYVGEGVQLEFGIAATVGYDDWSYSVLYFTVDGVPYTIPFAQCEYSDNLYLLGNPSIVFPEKFSPNEYPFCISLVGDTGHYYFNPKFYSEVEGEHSISIDIEFPHDKTYHKLAEEYLPDGVSAKSIESAQNTADSAKTAAETAQNTADSAKTAAETAQNTADSAKTAAETAQNTADSAKAGVNELVPNGKTWTQSNITSGGFSTVYYGDGVWVASSTSSNGLYYSTDGKEWTQSNITSGGIATVHYADGLWVAGGSVYSSTSKGLYYSTDGKEWTQSNITYGGIATVHYADGLWVVGKIDGDFYYSTDGKEWTQSNLTNIGVATVHYADGLWVVGYFKNGVGLYYSTDGKEWTQSNLIATGNSLSAIQPATIHYADGLWVVGYFGNGVGLYYSTDGKEWTQSNVTDIGVATVHYADGLWVAGSRYSDGGLYYSTDGKEWTQSNVTNIGVATVHYVDGLWVAASGSGGVGLYYSTDGKEWTQSNITSGNFGDPHYADGLWVAASGSGGIGLYYSTDGKEWTQSNITSGNFGDPHYADGLWVVGSRYSDGGLYYSTRKVAYMTDLEGYMANGDTEIIIASSTADSTKKFRITVDDTGTLTATEVTE